MVQRLRGVLPLNNTMAPFEDNYNNSEPATDIPQWVWFVATGIIIVGIIIGGVVLYERGQNETATNAPIFIPTESGIKTDSNPQPDLANSVVNDTVMPPADSGQTTNKSAVSITVDSDGDTIPDAVETYIGTDPAKADTDDDGYNDGEEIKNGYNPFGPGKLKFTL